MPVKAEDQEGEQEEEECIPEATGTMGDEVTWWKKNDEAMTAAEEQGGGGEMQGMTREPTGRTTRTGAQPFRVECGSVSADAAYHVS